MNRLAKIAIKNLRLRTYIGIKEDEIANRQDVVINVVIHYDANDSIECNDIDTALNYRSITKQIIAHVEENRFALLERMTAELLEIVMSHPRVLRAEVEVDKPHALRFADSVSLCLYGERSPR